MTDVPVERAGHFGEPGSVTLFELTLDDGTRRNGFLVRSMRGRFRHEHAGVVPAEEAVPIQRPVPIPDPSDVKGLVAYALADVPRPVG
jgi:hypothetical protein